ncbi:hypothetical protein [Enterocloster clostridioformis]|uniref:hypothetical protein n=1 Tax=Enterocloster clostridioformis TaxID=1531 RepID=UPI0003F9645A|nr:hypothetical protein [Enterocloster clostridioformis]
MKGKTLKGSLTVEAAWIMAMVLLSILVMLQQAGRIHDEAKAAMGLHEAVEKGRHGSVKELEASVSGAQEHMGRLLFFPDCNLIIKEKGQRIYGEGRGGKWKREIEAGRFRPETFLRKITLIEGLVKEDGY